MSKERLVRQTRTRNGVSQDHMKWKVGFPEEETELLTAVELAEFLDVPLSTIYYWRHVGKGPPALRAGRLLRFDLATVRAWLDRRRG